MKSSRFNFTRIIALIAFTFVLLASVPVGSLAAEHNGLSKKQLQTLIATAKTPAEHRTIAAYYREQARHLSNKSKEHQEMGKLYERNPLPLESKHPGTVGLSHCRYFTQFYAEQATAAESSAALHEERAKSLEQNPGN